MADLTVDDIALRYGNNEILSLENQVRVKFPFQVPESLRRCDCRKEPSRSMVNANSFSLRTIR